MSTLSLWTRRDPFAEFDALVRHAFDPAFPAKRGFVPAADLTRDGDDAVVSLELPGVDVNSDVTVEVDGGQLVVRGERREERSEQRSGASVREMRYGSCRFVSVAGPFPHPQASSASERTPGATRHTLLILRFSITESSS
jgi:HSP20 family protein